MQQKKPTESKPTMWYRIFHPGEEEMSDASSASPHTKPKNYAWGKSRRVDSDDEYCSDDSHSSFTALPPPSIELSKGGSNGKKNLRSSPSLFHEVSNDSDIESEDDKEAKPARSFVFNFWKSSPSIHPQASLPASASNVAETVDSSKKQTAPPAGDEFKSLDRKLSDVSLSEKYGTVRGVLGKGATATVRLCYPGKSKVKCAVKEFRKRKKEESKVLSSTHL